MVCCPLHNSPIHNWVVIVSGTELKQIEMKLLLAFCAVAEELHYGRAAARLHISQPPLSKYINRLERLVGTRLFERTTRSVSLTAAGAYFYAEVRRVCDNLEKAVHQTRGMGRNDHGVITVGIAPSVSHTRLVEALYSYREANPQVELRLQEMNSVDMVPSLRLNEIDAALMRPIATPREIETTGIFEERIGLVVRAGSSLAGAGLVSVERITDFPLIGYNTTKSPYFSELFAALFRQSSKAPNIVQTSQLPTILTLVEAGVGSAIVTESFARQYEHKLKFIPVQEADALLARLVVGVLVDNKSALVRNFLISIEQYMRRS